MRSIHPTDKNFPIKMETLMKCIENISDRISNEDIIEKTSICQEHLVANMDETMQKNGFSIKLVFEMNQNNERNVMVEEIILYEDMDEWLDALNNLNKRKLL